MVKNPDSGDVRGLEEIFRSQEFSRTSGTSTGTGEVHAPGGQDDGLVKRMFGHASAAVTDLRRGDDGAPEAVLPPGASSIGSQGSPLTSDGLLETASDGRGAADRAEGTAVSFDPWKRESGRYWTIAAVSALVALVVAGVSAGSGQQSPLHISAQGKQHATAQSHKGVHSAGGTSTGPTAPGSLTGAVGSGALLAGLPSAGTHGSATAPGGHVTLIGAATTTGTPFPSTTTSSGGSPGGGASTPPGSAGSNPVAPVGAGVGSTVSSVGSAVAGLANQLGSAVPAAAPTASAVSGVVSTLDQAVSATTL